jgi:YHS domain-containing protein
MNRRAFLILIPLAAAAVPLFGQTGAEKDPVCGMDVNPKAADTAKTQYQGKTYYFCSDSCKKSFEKEPAKYLAKKQAEPQKKKT